MYVFENNVGRQPKDCQPDYWLCVRAEEYDIRRDGPGIIETTPNGDERS